MPILEASLTDGPPSQDRSESMSGVSDDELHYVGFFAVGSGKAAVATLTAPPEQFEASWAKLVAATPGKNWRDRVLKTSGNHDQARS